MDLNRLTISAARELLDKGEITARALTDSCLDAIERLNPGLNAVLTVCAEEARAEAAAADKRLEAGERGPLLGIPYLCKDVIMTKGVRTTASSKILEHYIAPYDATAVKRLRAAGAILLGKTNLDEFAHGASTENSAYGPTKNPLDQTRVPGGSSGGSAAGVAADMCLFALGSDTGGSIRQPASFCGLYGLKPSYGRVSRFGLLSMTSSTDVIGPLTKTAADAAAVMAVISGKDELDATSAPEAVEDYSAAPERSAQPLAGIKIGRPQEYFLEGLDPQIKARLEETAARFVAAGAEIVEISLPHTAYGIPVYYIITPSEISSNLARFDGIGWGLADKGAPDLQAFYKANRGRGFGPEVKRRILLGTYALSAGYHDAYYKKAQAVRTLIIQDFVEAFKSVDLILTPTSPHPAFKLGEQNDDPLAMYLEDIFVTGASLAGLPALSFPAGKVKVEEGKELPVGAQLIAPRLGEGRIFRALEALGN